MKAIFLTYFAPDLKKKSHYLLKECVSHINAFIEMSKLLLIIKYIVIVIYFHVLWLSCDWIVVHALFWVTRKVVHLKTDGTYEGQFR